VGRNPEVIIAVTDAVAQAVRAVTAPTPIVWIGGDPMLAGLATSLARPAGNVTGVTVNAGIEIFGKRLQLLKEAVPAASKVAWLTTRTSVGNDEELYEAGRQLGISVIDMALQESTPSEVGRLFADIVRERLDAVIVNSHGDLLAHRQLIVALAEKNRRRSILGANTWEQAG
jgi:putative tryptophan/tyrosine transport system substrate-binding protein